MIVRDGNVPLRHHNSNPSKPVDVDGVIYIARPQHNVSIMWVPQELAERIVNSPLNTTKACNCNNGVMKPLFNYANEIDVAVHETGDRPR
jgi:hypothetical protein